MVGTAQSLPPIAGTYTGERAKVGRGHENAARAQRKERKRSSFAVYTVLYLRTTQDCRKKIEMDAIAGYASSSDEEGDGAQDVKMGLALSSSAEAAAAAPVSGSKRKREEGGSHGGEVVAKWRRTEDVEEEAKEVENKDDGKEKDDEEQENGKGKEKKKKKKKKAAMLIPTHVKRKKKNVSTEDFEKWTTAKDVL